MFTHIFHCSKENSLLSKEEILSLIPHKSFKQIKNFVLLEIDAKQIRENKKNTEKNSFKELLQRLAYTNSISEILFETNFGNLEKDVTGYDWKNVHEKDFCVRIISNSSKIIEFKFSEKSIGSIIWNKLKNKKTIPKVNLSNPTSLFNFFSLDKIYAAKHITDTDKSYLNRKPNARLETHPTSMNPKIVRVCINLTGLKKGILLDPFCGTGGILIEAGLMGFKVVGSDIDKIMIKRSEVNLEQYEIKKFRLFVKDATKINEKFDTIVTDLPYGKNSSLHNKKIKSLYSEFLENIFKQVKKKGRIVVIVPDFVPRSIINNFKIRNEFTFYIHKSLSKKVYVLEK